MSPQAVSVFPFVDTHNFVWDVGLLDWVEETQPGGGGGGTVDQGSGGLSPWLVTASSWPLPTGASTAARQDTGNTSLASIDTKLTSPLTVQATNLDIRDLTFASDKVDASGSAVTVSSSALPSNAAQETGGILATIATNTTGVALDATLQTLNALVAALTANGVVSITDPQYEDGDTQPISLTQMGRLRVSTVADEPSLAWGPVSAFDDIVATAKGFALDNWITIDSVWES